MIIMHNIVVIIILVLLPIVLLFIQNVFFKHQEKFAYSLMIFPLLHPLLLNYFYRRASLGQDSLTKMYSFYRKMRNIIQNLHFTHGEDWM